MSHATYVHVERRKLVGDRDGGGRATGTEGEKRERAEEWEESGWGSWGKSHVTLVYDRAK